MSIVLFTPFRFESIKPNSYTTVGVGVRVQSEHQTVGLYAIWKYSICVILECSLEPKKAEPMLSKSAGASGRAAARPPRARERPASAQVARPVPKSTHERRFEDMQAEELLRQIKRKMRAQEKLREATMPLSSALTRTFSIFPRLLLRFTAVDERSSPVRSKRCGTLLCSTRSEKAEKDRRSVSDLFPEPDFRPRVVGEMPDFELLQSRFSQEREERKSRRCALTCC